MSSDEESMPCPVCGKMHPRGPYEPRPERQKPGKGVPIGPADVRCECGALLRHFVPIFRTDRYGWHWRAL